MEAVPVLGFDAADDWVVGVFRGNLAAEGDGDEEAVSGALVVDLFGHLAGGFPGFGVDVLRDGLVGWVGSDKLREDGHTSNTHCLTTFLRWKWLSL